jgi:transposase
LEKKLPDLIAETGKDWTGEGPIRLMFMDEARFGRISDTRRCWCPKPIRPVCYAMVSQEYTYAYAAASVSDGTMDSLILPHVNGDCMQIFLDEVSARHPNDRIVMVLDGAGWHKNESLMIPDNLRLLSLPPYSPELNPVEHIWDDLREKEFHNRVFDSIDSLEDHLEKTLHDMEHDHERIHSIVAWPWIINALMN